ncbi:MAG: hypothetical protein A2X84_09070 [Desulfuromonadaceae bacterium GWC2_58_13]|nr:MAG: hypothetical protein A2X84_09070 [Desulfuromonadaceae bacterium GWC2_58_13]
MKTLSIRYMPKRKVSKWSKFEPPLLQRSLSFLLRDLLPSLVILIVLSLCVLLVAGKIDRAKHSHTVNMVDAGSHQ